MKKIFSTLFLFCFMFSYVFCVPSLAYTYQSQPIELNDNIIALNETNTIPANSSTQLYQKVNGVFIPVNTTPVIPTTTTQITPTTQYQQTTTTQYQPAPIIIQPKPQPVYTQTTTVTETIIEEPPSKGEKITAAIVGTVLIGGLITLLALTDGPKHHHNSRGRHPEGKHNPHHRR